MASNDAYNGVQMASKDEQKPTVGAPGLQPAAGYQGQGYPQQQAAYPNYPAQQAYPPQQQAAYAAYPPQQYNGAQGMYNPAYAAPHAAMPMAGAMPYQPAGQEVDDGQCRCGAGWVLFGVGWICWVTWVVGAFLPICDRTQSKFRNRRAAWIANVIMSILSTIFLIVIISLAATGKLKGRYYYYCTGYYCY